MSALLLLFGGILLGFLIGVIVANWYRDLAYHLGREKMMRDGDMFIRVNGRWHPHSPYKPIHHEPEAGRVMVNRK